MVPVASPTHWESHDVLQQKGSTAQTARAQSEQPSTIAAPTLLGAWWQLAESLSVSSMLNRSDPIVGRRQAATTPCAARFTGVAPAPGPMAQLPGAAGPLATQ